MNELYRVELDAFEGPLDLLLYLVRKHEVDIHDIPVGPITDQYLDHLEHVDRIDVDLAGEFLVMAATLMEIKSRWLDRQNDPDRADFPDDEPEPTDAEDPRLELVHQLLAYKRHRDAADELGRRRESWSKRFPAAAAGVEGEALDQAIEDMGDYDLEDTDLHDLVEAFRAIVSSVHFDRLGDHEVIADDTPIELHAEDIVDRLGRAPKSGEAPARLTLRELFEGRTRPEMIGLFLALLMLVRDQRVGVESGEGEVCLQLASNAGEETSHVGESVREDP
ncbi:MAG: segregation and condensation protein A [Phycisphaeraceae bacterium]|nr:MAG: segregation and condensation protein A [Phycisphaeraceae bacterium]